MIAAEWVVPLPSPNCTFTFISFGCVHTDHPGHVPELWHQCLEEIRTTPLCRAIGLGDYRDFLRKSQRDYVLAYNKDPDAWDELDAMVRAEARAFAKTLEPIKGKLVGLAEGNHGWKFKTGITDTQFVCEALGVPYIPKGAFARLLLRPAGSAQSWMFSVLVHHGDWSRGYQRTGGDINAVENRAAAWEADWVLFSHTHRLNYWKVPVMTLSRSGPPRVIERPRVFARTGCFVKGYVPGCVTYAEDRLMPPTAIGYGRIQTVLTDKSPQEQRRWRRARKGLPPREEPERPNYHFEVSF